MRVPVTACPTEIRNVADSFKDILGPEYKAFAAILCGYIFGVSNLSEIMRYFLFSPSVSSMNRLFHQSDLHTQLNRRHRRRIQKIMIAANKDPLRYQWAIDDTLVPHWGRSIWGTYYWKDHNTNGSVYGHKLMVLGLIDTKRKVLIPVMWEFLHREDREDSGETHKKGWEVAFELLSQAVEFGFPKFPVVMDSWFAGKELFEKLDDSGFDFVVELKNNRKVVGHGREKLDESIALFFSNRFRHKIFYLGRSKWATCATLLLNNMVKKLKIVAVANKKGLAHECFAYYATNRLAWDATKVWGISRNRWAIEVQFRELKQLFTLGGAAMQSKQAVETTISISMIALTVVRFEQLAQADASKNQYERPCTASSIVQKYTMSSLKKCILKLASTRDPETIRKFKIRLRPGNFGRKPTEKTSLEEMPIGA